jgi:hypothetical protein
MFPERLAQRRQCPEGSAIGWRILVATDSCASDFGASNAWMASVPRRGFSQLSGSSQEVHRSITIATSLGNDVERTHNSAEPASPEGS